MAELADALDLGSSTARCEGSSPFIRISRQDKGFSFCVTLPISLPQWQAYGSKKDRQGYGSNPSSFRIANKAAQTFLSLK